MLARAEPVLQYVCGKPCSFVYVYVGQAMSHGAHIEAPGPRQHTI